MKTLKVKNEKKEKDSMLEFEASMIEWGCFEFMDLHRNMDGNDACKHLAIQVLEVSINLLNIAKKTNIDDVLKKQKALIKIIKKNL